MYQSVTTTHQDLVSPEYRFNLTGHAQQRMDQRGVSESVVEFVLEFGRKIYSNRALFHVIGRKEISKLEDQCPELKALEGIHVVTSTDGLSVITVYRNSNLRAVRPHKRRCRHLH